MALTDLDKAIDAATAAITAPGGQLALGTANIRGVDYPVFEAAPQSLRDYLAFFLATNADKEFIVYQGERLTFGNIGVYRPELVAGEADGAFKLAPLLARAMRDGKLTGERYAGFWRNVGTPLQLAILDAQLRARPVATGGVVGPRDRR